METQTETQIETQVEPQTKSIKITKDTTIANVVSENPKHATLLTEIMTGFGIHCVGCGASTFETLEQGILGHGFSEDQLNSLIVDLNKAVADNPVESTPAVQVQDFDLTLTDAALNKVRETMKQREKENSILRVSAQAGGCSGFLYDLAFTDSPSDADLNFKKEDVNIAVDKNSMDQLNGMEIDFVDTLNESGFKFSNPNASQACGCGKSFN